MKLTTDFTVLRGFVRVVTTSVVTCAKNLETGTKFVLRSVKSRNVLCQLVIITAALLHLRYSRLHDCSGSSLPSLQSKMELQNECSGTQVPSLHLKPLPGHSEMVERQSIFIDIYIILFFRYHVKFFLYLHHLQLGIELHLIHRHNVEFHRK